MWKSVREKGEKRAGSEKCTVTGFVRFEGCKETRRPWPLKFPPGLGDGVRASPGANHADRFWAALRLACMKIGAVA